VREEVFPELVIKEVKGTISFSSPKIPQNSRLMLVRKGSRRSNNVVVVTKRKGKGRKRESREITGERRRVFVVLPD